MLQSVMSSLPPLNPTITLKEFVVIPTLQMARLGLGEVPTDVKIRTQDLARTHLASWMRRSTSPPSTSAWAPGSRAAAAAAATASLRRGRIAAERLLRRDAACQASSAAAAAAAIGL